ncbi:hypothetical protein REPUB_Repub19eG0001700 [Reevesia pubescens]
MPYKQVDNGIVHCNCNHGCYCESIRGQEVEAELPGSVADLVRRGQLRSDRRGISRPLKYDDPFNNPLVKVGKSNSTVEMCGKLYRLAPLTMGLCIAIAIMVVTVRAYVARKSRQSCPGSVADLVRRGQLRSDRRGMYDFVL